ncbi:hypothetical protein EB796_005765 [Bugula neritina]|uniref:Fucosyltransferase n=1 Tax=Bugula neritina TaxID=10212 RepID=A0A7J7KCI6_BUGNE|nr:hypothetical protein EB796_005765 [Bugula neritina]
MNYTCEKVLHSKYRFYLSFENSLCKDYITEKFWARLASDSHLLPVAIGGLSQQEYDDVAPPNSYIHAYNFTSLDHLGRYLKMLMTNDTAYNRYHEWRASYRVETSGSMYKETACKLCQLAHTGTKIPAQNNLDSWYSPRTTCRSHSMLPASGFSLFHEIKTVCLFKIHSCNFRVDHSFATSYISSQFNFVYLIDSLIISS